jgi:hypothetical protein
MEPIYRQKYDNAIKIFVEKSFDHDERVRPFKGISGETNSESFLYHQEKLAQFELEKKEIWRVFDLEVHKICDVEIAQKRRNINN